VVKCRLNDCNYVLQKSARSRPFVVHVDRMCKYNLDGQSDSKAENSDIQPLSDIRGESPRSHNQMSKTDINATAVSESTTAYQPVKSNTAARPADSIMSTFTHGGTATAAVTAPTEVRDSINHTDMTGTDSAGAALSDKPTTASDTSNFRINPANSTANGTHAQHDGINVDVANRPRPPQANRLQRTRRTPARLLSQVHTRQYESEFPHSIGSELPSCMVVVRSLLRSTNEFEKCQRVEMSRKESPMSMDESSSSKSSESSASSPSMV